MILTEEEAKEKACCANAARIFEDNSRIARGVCLGSACMAWRWYGEKVLPLRVVHWYDLAKEVPKEKPDGIPADWEFSPCVEHSTRYTPAYWYEPKEIREARLQNKLPMRGYCGLAEKPE